MTQTNTESSQTQEQEILAKNITNKTILANSGVTINKNKAEEKQQSEESLGDAHLNSRISEIEKS
ncbi:hypothetical protein IJX73_02085 [bacterium]|nr:hypothetical protein [bacterium]MBQ9149698.1 hypothetical protein [bacterium]